LLVWAAKTSQFGVWQLLAQTIQLVTGFLFVRWLSYDAYAQYGLAQGFQSALSQLVDLGFSGSIIALVGQRIHDRHVVGRYMKAAWRQRTGMMLIVLPLALPAFFWFAHSHGWSAWSSVLLFVSVIALLFFQGLGAIYSPALMMHQQLSGFYRPVVGMSAARLLVCGGLNAMSALGAVAVCWINALVAMATGFLYRSAARPYFAMPEKPDVEAEREMRKYLAPLIAGMIFYAFHGQIQVFLIALFGSSRSVAEVTALGRLGQLFVFLSGFITTMLVPFIARVPLERIALRYAQAIACIVVAGVGMSALAFAYPGVLLLLLGSKYADLQLEVGLSVTAAALGMVTGALYAFNNARKWVFHLTAVTSIGGLIVIEVAMIALMDLSTTRNVMIFSIVTAGYPILPFGFAAIRGYRRSVAEARAELSRGTS
jgi:O-antigen/teichoic acid export membrane protein